MRFEGVHHQNHQYQQVWAGWLQSTIAVNNLDIKSVHALTLYTSYYLTLGVSGGLLMYLFRDDWRRCVDGGMLLLSGK